MGYAQEWPTNNQPWNSRSPILSLKSDQWAPAPDVDPHWGFNFDEEMFGEAIRMAGDDPNDYWKSPKPMADQPP